MDPTPQGRAAAALKAARSPQKPRLPRLTKAGRQAQTEPVGGSVARMSDLTEVSGS